MVDPGCEDDHIIKKSKNKKNYYMIVFTPWVYHLLPYCMLLKVTLTHKCVASCWIDMSVITIRVSFLQTFTMRLRNILLFTFFSSSPCSNIASWPIIMGRNSLYVMCWMMAAMMWRVSWNNVSSSQWGFIKLISVAILSTNQRLV